MSNANEPAFPCAVSKDDYVDHQFIGLSRLDIFTLAAMNGLLANKGRHATVGSDAASIATATLAALAALEKMA
jgi:hypothetical protein